MWYLLAHCWILWAMKCGSWSQEREISGPNWHSIFCSNHLLMSWTFATATRNENPRSCQDPLIVPGFLALDQCNPFSGYVWGLPLCGICPEPLVVCFSCWQTEQFLLAFCASEGARGTCLDPAHPYIAAAAPGLLILWPHWAQGRILGKPLTTFNHLPVLEGCSSAGHWHALL